MTWQDSILDDKFDGPDTAEVDDNNSHAFGRTSGRNVNTYVNSLGMPAGVAVSSRETAARRAILMVLGGWWCLGFSPRCDGVVMI